MFIKTLAENTAVNEQFGHEHGLSLHIKTHAKDILFDMGKTDLFIKSAGKLGVDLREIDTAIVSHGHKDHGGGLNEFLKHNLTARIYVRSNIFGKYYSDTKNDEKLFIGLDERLLNDRFVFAQESLRLDDDILLFSGVNGDKFIPSGNRHLYKLVGSKYINDDFSHEQNLVIKEGEKTVLVAGCAHCGIVNIIEHLNINFGYMPTHVVGGFHLYNHANGQSEDAKTIESIAEYLLKTGAKYYTCHCTGLKSYKNLKSIMGERIEYLSTGSVIDI